MSPARVDQLQVSSLARAERVLLAALGAAGGFIACGGEPSNGQGEPPVFLDHLSGELPESIAALGLYADPSHRAQPHPRAQRYSPAQPLWSSGSEKERYIVLPEGAVVDSSDGEGWTFPLGTLLLKTFSYPDPEQPSGLRAIETRLLRREAEAFSYAVYLWSSDGSGAELMDLSRSQAVPVELEGELFEHVVPARLDCRKCHESQAVPVLGFDELGLNAPLDAASWESASLETAPTESPPTQLAAFLESGVLSQPPSGPARVITHEDPQTEQVLGYLEGNCTHCHNGGDRASAAFDLRYPVALANLIDQQTQGDALSGIRVVSGRPDQSALLLAFSRADIDGIQPMPPVGVDRVDEAAFELFESWIESLPEPPGG